MYFLYFCPFLLESFYTEPPPKENFSGLPLLVASFPHLRVLWHGFNWSPNPSCALQNVTHFAFEFFVTHLALESFIFFL